MLHTARSEHTAELSMKYWQRKPCEASAISEICSETICGMQNDGPEIVDALSLLRDIPVHRYAGRECYTLLDCLSLEYL